MWPTGIVSFDSRRRSPKPRFIKNSCWTQVGEILRVQIIPACSQTKLARREGCFRLIPVTEAAASERPLRHAADIHVSSCRVKAAPRSTAVPVLSVRAASTVSAKQRRSLHSYTLMFSSASFGAEPFVEAPKRSLLHRNEFAPPIQHFLFLRANSPVDRRKHPGAR